MEAKKPEVVENARKALEEVKLSLGFDIGVEPSREFLLEKYPLLKSVLDMIYQAAAIGYNEYDNPISKELKELEAKIERIKQSEPAAAFSANRRQAIQDKLNKINISNPADPKYNYESLYLLFNDGEMCLTKAGELWGMRGMHMVNQAKGAPDTSLVWPSKYNNYPCVIFSSKDQNADDLREEIFGNLSPVEQTRKDALDMITTPSVSRQDFDKMMGASMIPKLVVLANKLDENALHMEADLVDALAVYAKKTKEGKEPDVPDKVVEIADAIRRDNSDVSDEAAYRMAWETYCSYVNPSYEGCTSKGKSKRESPKSDYSD